MLLPVRYVFFSLSSLIMLQVNLFWTRFSLALKWLASMSREREKRQDFLPRLPIERIEAIWHLEKKQTQTDGISSL